MILINYLASHVLAFVLSAAVLGLLVGSFLNVLIYRLPVMMQREWRVQAREFLELPCEPVGERFNLLLPNSRCPHCAHRIRAWENVPLVSWLFLRGKCSSCQAPISCRYPLVELAGGFIFAGVPWLGSLYGYTRVPVEQVTPFHHAFAIICVSVFFLILLIDLEHKIIPDQLSIALFAVGWLSVLVAYPGFSPGWVSSLIGMFVLSAFFFVFALAIGGFGMGDVKLAVGIGALFGWQQLLVATMLSFLIGGAVAVCFAGYLLLRRKLKARIPIPFGPYLAVASVVSLFFAERIMQWYLAFFK